MSQEIVGPYRPGFVDYPVPGQFNDEERNELPVLACTKEALAKLDLVYADFARTQLWPHNVSNETLRHYLADPVISSRYTVVKFGLGVGLACTPYFEQFKGSLKPTIDWVRTAATTTKEPLTRDYFNAIADELEFGEEFHPKVWETRMSMEEEPTVDLHCGFSDRYGDPRFNWKFSPQGWTGKVDRLKTAKVQHNINQQILVWREEMADFVNAPDSAPRDPKIIGRYDNTERFSGLARRMKPNANNQPCEQWLRDRVGSLITFFGPSLEHNFNEKRAPFMRKIIPYDMRRYWSQEDINEAGILIISSHEPNHSVIRRESDEERLENQFAPMNEMYATVLGLATLGKRDDIPDKMKNAILGMFFATVTESYAAHLAQDTSRKDYLPGYMMIFNRLVQQGDIRIDNYGLIRWSDHRAFGTCATLAVNCEAIIARGSKARAEAWRREDAHFNNIRRLDPFFSEDFDWS